MRLKRTGSPASTYVSVFVHAPQGRRGVVHSPSLVAVGVDQWETSSMASANTSLDLKTNDTLDMMVLRRGIVEAVSEPIVRVQIALHLEWAAQSVRSSKWTARVHWVKVLGLVGRHDARRGPTSESVFAW